MRQTLDTMKLSNALGSLAAAASDLRGLEDESLKYAAKQVIEQIEQCQAATEQLLQVQPRDGASQ